VNVELLIITLLFKTKYQKRT